MAARYGNPDSLRARIHWDMVIPGAITLVVLALVAVVVVASVQGHERWTKWCHEEGGRVDSSTSHGYGWTTVNGKQQYGPVSTTTNYCLTDDGRIIDIEG